MVLQHEAKEATMDKTEPKFLTPAQVVERWDGAVTTGTLANWRTRGEGPAFQKFGTRVRYPVDALVAWETANRQQPANSNQADSKSAA